MRRTLPIILLFVCSVFTANAQIAKLQPFFIYNFIKQIEWPASSSNGDFVIGFLGNSEIIPELIKLSKTKKVNERNIVVKTYRSVSEISNCHILFIPANQNPSIAKALEKLGSSPTLLITETEGALALGSAINFVIRDSRQKFQVSKDNAAKRGLRISNYLIKLAVQ
jgi:hypothetical protein